MKMCEKLAAKTVVALLLLTLPAILQAQFTFITTNGAITITRYTGPGGAVDTPSVTNGLPVTSLSKHAFSYCGDLTRVTIPDSVTHIGDSVFFDCTNLSAITVDALNSIYSSAEGVLFDKSKTTLLQSPANKAGSYSIPSNVTSIANHAFSWCTGLTRITIPNSVASIGNSAFSSCFSLINVTIPDTVTSIGDFTFYGCRGLTDISIPSSVTNIGKRAFSYCSDLTSVTIPNNVASIRESAFSDCTNLSAINVDAPNSVYSSAEGVLFNKAQTMLIQCPAGKAGSYTIPGNVTRIGGVAFIDCSSLTHITVPDSVTDIGSGAFGNCRSLTDITIPNSVTSIGFAAFAFCTNLTSVTIGTGVTNIGDRAFANCYGLTRVYSLGNAPRIGRFAFRNSTNTTVYYLPGTTGWETTFGDRPTALRKP